ncbi:LOW QUALITY PROTEIN: crooked neck protein [Jimgerdemannia flammicorona]|uniref:Crooked neck protein n=1 Tax=Jimgerdemannia flammicorona TaxID=994334 RepID=A0A433QK96_9FUNG|nr:LOW QUALITY PROTEIN: crooked neck protein [Jimgerdemannia flammicorona]
MDQPQPPAAFAKNPRPPKVKNKNPAPVQITAEQILREAHDRRLEPKIAVPKQKITDFEELQEYRLRKRKEFEDAIRRNRLNMSSWGKYAAWEESQGELERARSVLERALDVDQRNVSIWLRYAEMEMKNRNVNHARNLFDRAVTNLPRVEQFWYKYTYMEEMLGEVPKARLVFERWMQWEPEESAWNAYIKMERRYNEFGRVRAIYERFVSVHPEPKNWLKWAKFEEEQNNLGTSTNRASEYSSVSRLLATNTPLPNIPEKCREIYAHAIEVLGDDHMDQKIFVSFAKYETKLKEYDRARVIYKYALDRLPKSKSESLYNHYTQFEKQYGDKEGIEDVVVGKRRVQYEEELAQNSKNYDVWFDYARLEEGNGEPGRVREVYERAIAQVPPTQEKRFWRRYIYLWINYALYEELETKDYERTRQIYNECLKIIPHKIFTFAKIWLLYGQFEIRRLDLQAARKMLGKAIGMCPKDKLFKGYIELELQLREFDRCRTLYTKYLEYNPANCTAWIKFAEVERLLGELERCRAIFELAVNQPVLDMPELLWKSYIDFEFAEEEYDRTRSLYERLLERTEHVKVWVSFAQFELSVPNEEDQAENVARARVVFEKAYKSMKEKELKEERVLLIESWRDFETHHGTPETLETVRGKMPKVVKKRRKVEGTEGAATAGVTWEEYYDYIFPDDEVQKPNFKLLAVAHAWRQKVSISIPLCSVFALSRMQNSIQDQEPSHASGNGAPFGGLLSSTGSAAKNGDVNDDDDEEDTGSGSEGEGGGRRDSDEDDTKMQDRDDS